MMHHDAIRYSLDPESRLSELSTVADYDAKAYEALKDRVADHGVEAMMSAQGDMHHKLLPIRPRVQILYRMGDLSLLNRPILAIVGPRKMSSYGQEVVEHLFDELERYDVVTISGLAEGVDQLCHRCSLAKGIPTIAVL